MTTKKNSKAKTKQMQSKGAAPPMTSQKLARAAKSMRVSGAKVVERTFPPPIPGILLKTPKLTRVVMEAAKQGLPELNGYVPSGVPIQPLPSPLPKSLQVRTMYAAVARKGARSKSAKKLYAATTVFPPDERSVFSDTSYPWRTLGRVETAGGISSGVMVGPRHLLTVSHGMVWNSDGTVGWVKFVPSYFDGNAPFGEAWSIRWYAYRKVVPPLDNAELREDYVVLVLDRRVGDTVGWMGSRTYSDDWDNTASWAHAGYPSDLTSAQRPTYQDGIRLDGDDVQPGSHQAIYHKGDVATGQSGGPFFAWWSGETFPRVVSVQSAHDPGRNYASGGSQLVDLITRALNEFP